MSAHKVKRNGVILFITLLVFILGWGAWSSLKGQSFEEWIKEKDIPIVKKLNRGATLFEQGRFGESSVEFREAYDQAELTNSIANDKWKDKIEKLPVPRKFYKPDRRSPAGLMYFKNRMNEAALGLSSSIFQRVLFKYRKQLERSANGIGPRFTPPANELQPAIDVIDTDLKHSPQNESLRLLKSDILIVSGAYAEALNILNEVLLINPTSAEAYNQLGLIYSSQLYMNSQEYEQYREKALAMFEKSALLKDIDGMYLADPQYNLGMYYSIPPAPKAENALPSKPDALKAISHLLRFIELAPKDDPRLPQVKDTLKKLEQFKE